MAKITTNGIIGFCVGDALGVPYEFTERSYLKENPAVDMIGYGTYNQPKGTWSDDTSMVLCTIDSLINGLNYNDIASKYIKWLDEGYMTPYNEVFDVGNTTANALAKYEEGIDATTIGLSGERDLGNGSLMRVLPLAYYLYIDYEKNMCEEIKKFSSITHSHSVAAIACSIYSVFVQELLDGQSMWFAYANTKKVIKELYSEEKYSDDLKLFSRILDENIALFDESEINSTGYVIDTLESVLWCFLNGDDYKDSVLKAVNLGGDTDTISALVGGLSGIYHGYEDIPKEWIECIVKKDEIIDICNRFYDFLISIQK